MILFALLACFPDATPPEATTPAPSLATQMATQPLVLTRHGECRMACRHIDRDEVEATLREGRHVPERTRDDGECPSHAFEHRTADGQQVRVIFAACPTETRVVTAIDLDREWDCDCP